MSHFRFIHAADLHLDSPLLGLAARSSDFAKRVDEASQRAFDRLIALAIEEKCNFLVISGDLFDGRWRDYRTGLYFVKQMRRLHDAGIPVYLIHGNHDAENPFASRLEHAPNVTVFSSKKAATFPVPGIDASIHGRSFPQRDVSENIALKYPPPIAGHFNIGLLHTACEGRDDHEYYAPCTVDQLINHGYDYWALGHVHTREILNRNPHIVYPGNIQGRHFRETGPKGVMLVSVKDGRVTSVEEHDLDAVRWLRAQADLSSCTDMQSVLAAIRSEIVDTIASASGRGIALRLQLHGATVMHGQIVREASYLREEVETIAASLSDDIWIEKLEFRTAPAFASVTDPTVAGRMRQMVEQIAHDPSFRNKLEQRLADVKKKIPLNAHGEELLAEIRREQPSRALALALCLIENGGE